MAVIPTTAERASLEFVTRMSFGVRYFLALIAFVMGALICFETRYLVVGLMLAALGHVPLWVRKQRLSPGGATPDHEEVWAPVDEGWYDRVVELERAGQRWDISFWDVTNTTGCVTMLLITGAIGGVSWIVLSRLADFRGLVLMAYLAVVFLPIWFNGRRYNWHPSELRLKGGALEQARTQAGQIAPDVFDAVPLLALREGRRGPYPVDARLMLRPRGSTGGDVIGVQVQVAINNVQGRGYPYLYCVVLAKVGFRFPDDPDVASLVVEAGTGEGVDYRVIRQYADNRGGWHTDATDIALIVRTSLELAQACLS